MDKKMLLIFGIIFLSGYVAAQIAPIIHYRPQWIDITDTAAFLVQGSGGNISFQIDTSNDYVKTRTITPLKIFDMIGTKQTPFDKIYSNRYYGQRENLYTDSPITCAAMCKTLETQDPNSGTWSCYGAIRYDRMITTCQDGALPRNCICQNG